VSPPDSTTASTQPPLTSTKLPPPAPLDVQAARPAEPLRLWFPRDILIGGALFGYPGALGLAARNAWRLGRKSSARLDLLVGIVATAVTVFVLPDSLGRSVFVGINYGAVAALYYLVKAQHESLEGVGRQITRAPGGSGILTFLGGWAITAGPTFLLILVVSLLGSEAQDQLSGNVIFAPGGSGCDLRVNAPIKANGPMHWVAYLSREVHQGDTVELRVTSPGIPPVTSNHAVGSTADCLSGNVAAFGLGGETYSFEVLIGSERLSYGTVTISGS
jgi:hypothetical protein